jgi:hypothetical protein
MDYQEKFNKCRKEIDRIEQRCAKALGYPMFKDDQEVFPGATDADGYFIGEHAGLTIVDELAAAYENKQLCTKLCFTRGLNVGKSYTQPSEKSRLSLLAKLRDLGFGRIAANIQNTTPEELFKLYDSLLYDTRGTRQGFPKEVFTTLMRLYLIDVERPNSKGVWENAKYR